MRSSSVYINMQSPDSDKTLLKCVSEGATLIVTQVDVTDLASNKLYMDLLRSKSQLYLSKSTTKLEVSILYI